MRHGVSPSRERKPTHARSVWRGGLSFFSSFFPLFWFRVLIQLRWEKSLKKEEEGRVHTTSRRLSDEGDEEEEEEEEEEERKEEKEDVPDDVFCRRRRRRCKRVLCELLTVFQEGKRCGDNNQM